MVHLLPCCPQPREEQQWQTFYAQILSYLPSMGQQKFVVPQLLHWWLVFDVLSLNIAFCYSYSMKDVPIASHFPRMCSHLWSGRSAQKLAYSLTVSPQMAVLFILLSAGSCFLTFCAKFDTHALLSPLRHHKYHALCTCYWVLVRTASDWVAAVRCHWLRTSRYMSRHAQKVSSEYENSVKILFHQAL
jgi:hypothetical protein